MNKFLSKSKAMVYSIWMVASVFYAYQYILRVLPNIAMDEITHRFHIGAALFGQFSGLYYIGYSLVHIPIGIMLDRIGPKKVMPLCILLTVVGTMPLIFSSWWVMPIFGRILIGIGSSAAILGVFKIIRMIFSEKQFTKMLSFSVMIGLIGAIYGGGPLEYMKATMGFDALIYCLAASGILLAIFTYFAIPHIEATEKRAPLSGLKEVLRNKKVLLTCFFAGLMVGPLEGFADVWASAYLKSSYHLDAAMAASVPSMIFIGMCFGSPVLSWLSSKLKNDLITIIGSAIAMGAIFTLVLLSSVPTAIISTLFVIVGVCCSYQILSLYKASTYVREEVAGLTTAVCNMITMSFGYAFHTGIGLIVETFGSASSARALTYGISLIPIALFIAAVGFFFLYKHDQKTQLSYR